MNNGYSQKNDEFLLEIPESGEKIAGVPSKHPKEEKIKPDTPSVATAASPGEHLTDDPSSISVDDTAPLAVRLNAVHRELRASGGMEPLQGIAIAIYDPGNNLVKTFVESSIGVASTSHYEAAPSDRSLLRRLTQTRVTRVVDEITPGTAGRLGELYRLGYRSSMTVPIYRHGRLFGFIFFNATHPGFFSRKVSDWLSPYAKLITLLLIHEIMTVGLVRAVAKTAQEVTRLRDYETATHLDRMSSYARLVAIEGAGLWGLSDEFIEHIFWFAPLHDIGKVGVRDDILLKPGRLSGDEMNEMKRHVAKGVAIIDAIVAGFEPDFISHLGIARNIIASHHENVDGSGYPLGVSGNDIPIEGRIVAVADVFDALTSERPYKRKWSNEKALHEMRELIGRKFDRDCVEALVRRMDDVVEIQERFQGDHDA